MKNKLSKAEEQANKIIQEAEEKARKILTQSELFKALQKEAKKLKESVIKECEEIKKNANIKKDAWFSQYSRTWHIYGDYWFIIPKGEEVGYIANSKGKALTKAEYTEVYGLADGDYELVCVLDANYRMMYLAKDIFTTVIPAIYDHINIFRNGLASVKLNDKWGFVDIHGTVVIPIIYDSVSDFRDGASRVKLNDRSFKINTKGVEIT